MKKKAPSTVREGAIASHSTETTDATWDASENVGRIPNDAGASTLREEYAWVDSGADADTKSAYKFPHHIVSADGDVGAADTAACSNGIAVLNGGRGGADISEGDRKGVYNHLAAHLKDAGKEAPALSSATEALRKMGKTAIKRLGESKRRLQEAGRVLSAANEEKLKNAVQQINDVLGQLGTPEEDDTTGAAATESARKMREAKRQLAEAWCDAAWDASGGAYLLAELIQIMGDESDEPEQYAMLKQAFDGLSQWIQAEIGEIGSDEDDDVEILAMPLFDYEARRAHKVKEAIGPVVPLKEGAIRSDGTTRLKVIQPGWGSSGYYSAEVLERDGPEIFKAGLHNFWDHPTFTEEVERPERSVRDLAGQLTTDVVWEADGPEGPGLYADAQVRTEFAAAVNELASFKDFGVSIRALGTAHMGEAEGKSGPIIDKLIAAESIDYVTTPGAGGRVLQIFEAAGRGQHITTPKEAEIEVNPEDTTKLKETNAEQAKEIARLREVHLVRDAKEHITAKLAEVEGIPEVTRARLVESLSSRAKADKDGKLDLKQLDEAIEKTVKEEAEYLAKATGAGKVIGFGSSDPKIEEKTEAEIESLMKGRGFGLSEAEAKVAARGRG